MSENKSVSRKSDAEESFERSDLAAGELKQAAAQVTVDEADLPVEKQEEVASRVEETQLAPAESPGAGRFSAQIPNVLTIVRIILVPVFILFIALYYYQAQLTYAVIGLIVFCVAAYTDHLDGKLARRWKIVSNFGKIADPIADKALMMSAFIMLSLWMGLFWWFTIVVILRELAVTLLRMALLRNNIVVPASKSGKVKTCLQILLVFMWLIYPIIYQWIPADVMYYVALLTMGVLVATFVVTVLSGLVYFLDARDNRKAARANAEPKQGSKDSEDVDPTRDVAETDQTKMAQLSSEAEAVVVADEDAQPAAEVTGAVETAVGQDALVEPVKPATESFKMKWPMLSHVEVAPAAEPVTPPEAAETDSRPRRYPSRRAERHRQGDTHMPSGQTDSSIPAADNMNQNTD